jgi:hypothetical protein
MTRRNSTSYFPDREFTMAAMQVGGGPVRQIFGGPVQLLTNPDCAISVQSHGTVDPVVKSSTGLITQCKKILNGMWKFRQTTTETLRYNLDWSPYVRGTQEIQVSVGFGSFWDICNDYSSIFINIHEFNRTIQIYKHSHSVIWSSFLTSYPRCLWHKQRTINEK